jgi:2-dehydro-3-deoxy-D-arabinonate dehydratase
MRTWTIRLEVQRKAEQIFVGDTKVNQIKRSFHELAGFLFRSQTFPRGAILLTGTGVIPPDNFTLEDGDTVRIEISGIGVLTNPVMRV